MTTTTRRNRPVQITDAPEHRSIPLERIELRASEDDDNEIVLEGYASTFEEYDMYGGPKNYGWTERIDPKAFDVTLREKPDLHLLINHAGMPLARTKSGNLDLKSDKTGLKVVARLDKRDPEVQSLSVKMERGDMDEMSFAFRVKAQEWKAADGFDDDNQSYRTITEVSLHKGDVSVVNWGANPTTSVGLRSLPDALQMLADADESEFAEIRGEADVVNLKVVQERLTALRGSGPVVTIENINVISDEVEKTEERDEEEETDDEVQAGTADDVTFASQIAEMGAEALVELATEMGKRVAELEALKVGTAESEEEDERSEETDEVDEVHESSRLAEALAEMGELPEEGTFSVAAAEAFVD